MFKVTRVLKKPNRDVSWYLIPYQLYDMYADMFIYSGKVLSTRITMSDDQLEMHIVQIFQDRDSIEEFFSSKNPFRLLKRKYEEENNFIETDPIIEYMEDSNPYLQQFLFEFSVINHESCTDDDKVIHDATHLIVEPRDGPVVRTYDPKGPAW